MPYKNKQAKQAYQRAWIRSKRMRSKLKAEGRIVEPLSNPEAISVEPKYNTLPDLQAAMDAITAKPIILEDVPTYNPAIHKAGDKVMLRGRVATVVETDAEGNPLPEY